ncbi:1-(5-phosphoribosyl)-5-[(5-phosphoribosylamino)methylideneamino]imidazole-4-carboxamide isomerase [Methanocaldococcus sp.]
MQIIPAVDIKNKKCVQLIQGDPNKKLLEIDNPIEVAKKWEERGAKYLHVVDLDAALGEGDNLDVIEKIINSLTIPVEVGGGIRSLDRALKLIDIGADRIIVGTKAILNKNFLEELNNYIDKNRIVLAVESKGDKVVVKGWKEEVNLKPIDVIKEYEDLVGYILYTNVDVEGLMKGIDIKKIKEIVENSGVPIIYSGGVSSLEDIKKLKEAGVYAVIIGSALYKGKIKLEEINFL